MGGGAWPFLVGGAICLVCDALRCYWPHARYTDVSNEFTPWPTGPDHCNCWSSTRNSYFRISPNPGTKSVKENATKQPAFANPETVFVRKQCCNVKSKMTLGNGYLGSRIDEERSEMSVLTCGGEFNSRHIVRRFGPKALDDPKSSTRPQVRRDHPLNLSISISGGKETNKDSLSNGERTGKSPS
ncbi:unnamed protein product [Brassica rapa]|uniref:Uncharacterized protein n=1 Tax=Brassica campestris TaxID=3711 RepID=A0A8D9CXB0_BRACM|nr:unnamed protein product [Brassica rapa]